MPRTSAVALALCAEAQAFSLRAAVGCGADERKRLEQLCRYITRPALANDRVQCNSAGRGYPVRVGAGHSASQSA